MAADRATTDDATEAPDATEASGGDPTTAPAAEAPTAPAFPFPPRPPFELPEEFARRRREAPVAPVTLQGGRIGWLVTRYDDVRTVLSDERFSREPVRKDANRRNAPAGGGGGFDFGMSIADPARHARWRRLAAQVFNVRQAEALRPRVRAIVDRLLDEMTDGSGSADLMGALASRLPLLVLFELFDVTADLQPAFLNWAASLRRAGASMAEFGATMHELHKTAQQLVARRSGAIGDLLSVRLDDGTACDEELATATVLLMTVAGYETVGAQLGNGFLALFQHPDQLALLRDGAIDIEVAVEEILRYAQAGTGFAGMTFPTTDVVLAGTTIPAGAPVLISIDSAGRDEAHVADPDTFELARGAARNHLTFGFGAHFCLGAPIARVELQEAIGRTLARLPDLRLVPDVGAVEMTANMFTRFPKELEVTW